MLRVLLILAFMAISISGQAPNPGSGVSRELARWRAANYSEVTYNLRIKLAKGAPLMTGTVEVGVMLTAEGAANDLILDWRTTPFANDKDKPYAKVLKVNGASGVAANVVDEHLVVPKSALAAGRNEISIEFASPVKTSGAAVTRYVDKEDGGEYVYTLFVPSDASMAFPVFDQPDLKAKFRLSVDVPAGWHVVSNGLPNVNGSLKSRQFFETLPISPYVFAFAAGDFKVFSENFSDRGLGNGTTSETDWRKISEDARKATGSLIYVRRSQVAKFKQHEAEVFRLNREGVKFLEEYFDYKFPFPKYDLVLIPEFPFGGMEHAGATFLREASVIFPTEPTKNDYISRANVIFHEAAHQWFGDTVTMKWFDDLWLKEGFAEFMAYKTLEKVMPEYNAWKVFYERNKQAAYLTDSTKGTTPIYQEIPNLSAAKSAYGNIVYRKAPSFLRQAEFYLGEKEFQTAVRTFLKKHQFANAGWDDLVGEFQAASWSPAKYGDWNSLGSEKQEALKNRHWKYTSRWAGYWVKEPGVAVVRLEMTTGHMEKSEPLSADGTWESQLWIVPALGLALEKQREDSPWEMKIKTLYRYGNETEIQTNDVSGNSWTDNLPRIEGKDGNYNPNHPVPDFIFPNYQDYGYGIFLLDEKNREYALKNVGTEKDDFLRSMMWGSLWDSVREGELDPKAYVELAIKNIAVEQDESTIQTILGRVGTAINSYSESAGNPQSAPRNPQLTRLEAVLAERIANASTIGQRITYYRAYLNLASTPVARKNLKEILAGTSKLAVFKLRTKDKFDIVTRLMILGDPDAESLLAGLEKSETSDDAKRYAYAARAGVGTEEAKAKYFKDFLTNKDISESWIEAAFGPFNSTRHSALTLKYLETALAELPNLKKNRKIFFVNGWLAAFIGGQKSKEALAVVNKFLADNPNLDRDLRLKVLEVSDGLERAVRIREKFGR